MPEWVRRLQAQADAPPASVRQPLWLAEGTACIGSVEPAVAQRMQAQGLPVESVAHGWAVRGEPSASLESIARWLSADKLAGRWRNELLPVTDSQGRQYAVIERAVIRPLGIASFAVHLVGTSVQGAVWVQQRALNKATDPGLWDTMVGGLQSAGESTSGTLLRETWEEAGLRVAELLAMQPMGVLTVRRPVPEGYMVEHIEMFECVLPALLEPVNQDGEVERFECIAPEVLWQWVERGDFTLEAALILVRWGQKRGVF